MNRREFLAAGVCAGVGLGLPDGNKAFAQSPAKPSSSSASSVGLGLASALAR